jgi:hypothetical protein
MTRAFDHLLATCHSLAEFRDDPDPDLLARRLSTASSGERVMIHCALSLIPRAWLSDEAADATRSFRLDDVSSLDEQNAQALIEAIAIATGYPSVAGV